MRVTRKDVAALAGVSETTVSFALSGKRYVSEELVKKVNEAVETLGYYPDMIAKTMRNQNTYSLAVLIKDFTNPLHMQIIKSIENIAVKNGYFVNICGGGDHLERYINEFISRRVDGVFIVADSYSLPEEYINKLLEHNVSVAFGSADERMDKRICGVGLDFKAGMKEIVTYLKSIGHRDIAYISSFAEGEEDVRAESFRLSVKECLGTDNPLVENFESENQGSMRAGYILTERLLDKKKKFTCVVCMNDMMAFGAISAIQNRGLRVPDDISVVGIDNINFSGEWGMGLTTLSHRADYFGELVFKVLHDNILDKSVVERITVTPELVIRKSTKKI